MADPNELNPNLKVRDLVFAFEHQTQDNENNFYEENHNRPRLHRTKSVGNVLSYKILRQPKPELNDIIDIEKEIIKIETHLNYYEVYDKESHIAFQEQLFDILTSIVNIDTQGSPNVGQKKKQLVENTQNLARILNGKLPLDNSLKKIGKKSYTVNVKREESVSTPVKYNTHITKIVHENSVTGNNTTTSYHNISSFEAKNNLENEEEESLEQKKYSATKDESPTDKTFFENNNSGFLPSVKKLKAFFSFRKSDKDEDFKKIKETNVSRSQSMMWKTKYALKESKKVETNYDVSKVENIEGYFKEEHEQEEPELYKELSIDLDPVKETSILQQQTTQSISVKKLKKLFEEEKKDSTQGLETLSSSQPIKLPETSIAFTEMNLGAFRLKRSLSGQYINQAGVLSRNLSTSKSTEDVPNDNRRDSLVIDKFGNIENDIDGDDEEQMPSMDYIGGMPSLGYEVNTLEQLKENEDKVIPQVEQTIAQLATSKDKSNEIPSESKNLLDRNIPQPLAQKFESGLLTTINNVEPTTNNSDIVETEQKSKEEIIQNMQNLTVTGQRVSHTVTHHMTQVGRVSTHKVHSLVTSFEKQISDSEYQNDAVQSVPNESAIAAQYSPASHQLMQNIIYSKEEKEEKDLIEDRLHPSISEIKDADKTIDHTVPDMLASVEKTFLDNSVVEEPESLPLFNESAAKQNHDVTISEILLPTSEEANENVTELSKSSEPADINANKNEDRGLNVPNSNGIVVVENNSNALEGSVANLNIKKHFRNENGIAHFENNINASQESFERYNNFKLSNNSVENDMEHSINIDSGIETVRLANNNDESNKTDVNTDDSETSKLLNKLTANQTQHSVITNIIEHGSQLKSDVTTVTKVTQSETVNTKKTIILDKSLTEDLFADLDVNNVEEEFDKLLQENKK